MHLYPLWSAAFQHRLERFVSDLPLSQTDDERPDHMSDQRGSGVTLQRREAKPDRRAHVWPTRQWYHTSAVRSMNVYVAVGMPDHISLCQLSLSSWRGKWMRENYRNWSPGRKLLVLFCRPAFTLGTYRIVVWPKSVEFFWGQHVFTYILFT